MKLNEILAQNVGKIKPGYYILSKDNEVGEGPFNNIDEAFDHLKKSDDYVCYYSRNWYEVSKKEIKH